MEMDAFKQRFLHDEHRGRGVRWCADMLSDAYLSWSLRCRVRAIGGGPPCVFASLSGRRRGLADRRSDPMTIGIGKVARAFGGPDEVWCIDVGNVDQVATLDGGAALITLDDALAPDCIRTPRVVCAPLEIEVLEAADLGMDALRRRSNFHYEASWAEALVGPCPLIRVPDRPRGRLANILEPSRDIAVSHRVPGRFSPLPGAHPDANGILIAGYHEYGAATDPFVRGSLVWPERQETPSQEGTRRRSPTVRPCASPSSSAPSERSSSFSAWFAAGWRARAIAICAPLSPPQR